MTIQFLRLKPVSFEKDAPALTFRCELPDADTELEDSWLDCGTIVAHSHAGILEALDLNLNATFVAQFDDGRYDLTDLLEAVVLWIGWESSLVTSEHVSIELRDPAQHIRCDYAVELNEVSKIAAR